jgi:DNA uptake protein ComE-like DNA-binding protein
MRLKQLALATFFAAAMALPALAQTAPAPASAPAAAPAKPVAAPAKPVAATAAAKPAAAPTAPVSINTATAKELDALPGIGKARAAAIIKGRPYKATDELDSKKVIPHATYEKITGSITL